MIRRNPFLSENCKVGKTELEFTLTGSRLVALAADATGNSGANFLTSSSTEVWGVLYEAGIRAYEEMTPPPGRSYGLPALRICDSYAGFISESDTWHGLVDRGLRGDRLPGDWAVWKNAGLILFHMMGEEARQRCYRGTPEEAAAYYTEQAASLRPATFTRMHSNERTTGEGAFLPPGAWDACYSDLVKAGTDHVLVLGADASTTRDTTSLIGCYNNRETDTVDVELVRIWKPQKSDLRGGKPTVDLDETIGAEVLRLKKAGVVQAVYADPYQLHTLILTWQKAGINVAEVAQNAGRIEADQSLYDAVISRTIRHYGDPSLNEHLRNATALETPRGFRLAKEKMSRKIDAAVALSMAHYGARSLAGMWWTS